MIRRDNMLKCLMVVLLGMPLLGFSDDEPARQDRHIVIVLGAAGNDQYGEQFTAWADRWASTAEATGIGWTEIGRSDLGAVTDKSLLMNRIAELGHSDLRELWIVLIGHGTFYRDVAKFNLRGEDVSAKELGNWIGAIDKRLVIVNCASSSGPFINRLSGKDRTIITATKSGNEQNFARFGDYLSKSIADMEADLDHDDEVSILEAFLHASGKVEQFYESEDRLATEHALIDDNGDGRGTPRSFFYGVRVKATAKSGDRVDGPAGSRIGIFRSARAIRFTEDQLIARSAVETKIEQLRDSKDAMPERDYYEQLQSLLVEMAELYETVEQGIATSKSGQ